MHGDETALTALVTASAPTHTGPTATGWDVLSLLPDQITLAGGDLLRLERHHLPQDPEPAAARVTALVAECRPDVVLHVDASVPAAGLGLVATAYRDGHEPLAATWPAHPLTGRMRGHGVKAAVLDAAAGLDGVVLHAGLSACLTQGLDDTLTGLLHVPATDTDRTSPELRAMGCLLVELADQVRRHRAWHDGHGRLSVPRPVRTLRVGLTGGIGSGKSTVAHLLTQWGALVVDADALAREALAPGSTGLERLRELFGDDLIDPQGAVDRPALAARVFDDPQARAVLESITLPWIAQTAAERIESVGPGRAGVYDVPLLAEGGMADLFDLVVVVETPLDQRLERLERRGLPRPQARARIRSQATDAERRALADVVLLNDGTEEDLADGVGWLWEHRVEPALA